VVNYLITTSGIVVGFLIKGIAMKIWRGINIPI
jgi:hypothetical protein